MSCKKFFLDKNYNILINEYYDEEYAYVYILLHILPNGKIVSDILVKDNPNTRILFKTFSDGYYSLITLIIPKDPTNYYYYKDRKFYKGTLEVSLKEIMETNPHLSNVISRYDYYFVTARLRKCYVDACYDVFNSSCDKCHKVDTYNRDLIWSALNTIEYLAELGQYEEALRLLRELTDCNGICLGNHLNCRCYE